MLGREGIIGKSFFIWKITLHEFLGARLNASRDWYLKSKTNSLNISSVPTSVSVPQASAMTTPNLSDTYGAMYIGCKLFLFLISVFDVLTIPHFQGVLTVQAYLYYESFPKDPLRVKLVVAAVWIADFVHLVLISSAGYHYFIANWGNVPALMQSTEELDLHLALIGVATIICQGFFLHRVWLLSNRQTLLVIVLGLGCLTTFSFDVGMSVVISRALSVATFTKYTPEVIALFSTGAGSEEIHPLTNAFESVDLIIAAFLCYYLMKGRSGVGGYVSSVLALTISECQFDKVLGRSNHAIHSRNWTCYKVAIHVQTQYSFSILLAFACLVAAMHFSLGGLYTNALLASLNARRSLRSRIVSVTPFVPSPNNFSSVISEQTYGTDQSMNGIQVIY
ncbi:hypothetical protein CVT26_007712 [Gymnopilus dilepis]|uniref:DUF6534 domain-containing protein n=1 Tax=Gymnopilus dilepis TaxID=231916 RepID=A0A409WLV6_9AGAR|nr:hypothetical protein CVT26_007712 [Gymnopilus dilepis]